MKTLNLQDVGTLEQHLYELLDLWSDTLATLLEHSSHAAQEPAQVTALRRIAECSHEDQVKRIAQTAIKHFESPTPIGVSNGAAMYDLSRALEIIKKTLENTPGLGGMHGNYDERAYYRAVNAPVTIKVIDNNVPLV